MEKITGLRSVLEEKCPRCRKGQMFVTPPYHLRHFTEMHKTCPVCGLNYEPEPGFFTGAMYVSYAFSVAIFVIVGFSLFLFFGDPDLHVYVITIFSVVLILFPLLYRYSRVVYLHLFGGIKYKPDIAE